MTTNEDIWEQPAITTVTEAPIAIETPIVEEPIETPVEQITFTDEQLSELFTNIESAFEEEIQTKPTNFIEKEEIVEEIVEEIPEEELLELLEFNDNFQKENEELTKQLDELNIKLNNEIAKQQGIEQLWQTVVSHPILWKYVLAIAKWEELNIPNILQQWLTEWLDSIPWIQENKVVSVSPKKISPWDRITNAVTRWW